VFVSIEPDRHRFDLNRPGVVKQVDVNGSNAAPLYKFLKSEKGGLFGERVKWNFTKFLVDKDGHVVGRFAPISSPSSIEVMVQYIVCSLQEHGDSPG
jgi:glutathione peroxidase